MGFMDIFSVKSIDNTVNAVIDTGDMLYYSDEEKAKAEQLKVDTKLRMLPLFEPFKIAQRYIAFVFVFNFLVAFWVGVGFFIYAPTYLATFMELVKAFELGWIMLAITSFYYGGGFVESYKKTK